MSAALMGSKCQAMFWTDLGSGNWAWLPVQGEITEASRETSTEGRGISFIHAEVLFQTQNGPKKGQISRCSQKVLLPEGGVARQGDTITGERLKDAVIISDCSRKVIVL